MGKVKGMFEENMERNPELYDGSIDYELWIESQKKNKQTKITQKGRSIKCQTKKKNQ